MASSSRRAMTKSPLALAQKALRVARGSGLDPYFARRSRKDFTTHQWFAIAVVRRFLRLDYRGMVQLLADFSDLRAALKLTKTPHYTAIEKAEKRLEKKGLLNDFTAHFSIKHVAKV
jgi:hypothetical protein